MTGLEQLSSQLLEEWCQTLLQYQLRDNWPPVLKGGLLSPAYGRIEGRCAETCYPFLYMADKKNDQQYVDAAILLFNWAEANVCFPDGSWVNEISISDWKGVTVNAVIALGEALMRHGHLLNNKEKQKWDRRLNLSVEYVFNNFRLGYGNINYPIVAAYALELAGQYFNKEKYCKRAKELIVQVKPFFTAKDNLLYGEGTPYDAQSPKGCYAMDLGYNMEESLPALVLYGILSGSTKLLDDLTATLLSHLEFMLPDGGIDNSWGTRNYKWTYWGSRNSDGCQPAYALLSRYDERFYEASLRNTQLLKKCTKKGILQAGPHNDILGIAPSLHQSFCHAKSLATILDYGIPNQQVKTQIKLPREEVKGVKELADIQTWLISKDEFKATITGYDREYAPGTHASGGALSLLWHNATGPLLSASMTEYQMLEASNMHMDKTMDMMPLTPLLELYYEGNKYRNISDLSAIVKYRETKEEITFIAECKLVDEDQNNPKIGALPVVMKYVFKQGKVYIDASCSKDYASSSIKFYLPVITNQPKSLEFKSPYEAQVKNNGALIKVVAQSDLLLARCQNNFIFNYVPGFMAIPFCIKCNTFSPKLFSLVIEVINDKTNI